MVLYVTSVVAKGLFGCFSFTLNERSCKLLLNCCCYTVRMAKVYKLCYRNVYHSI